LEDELLTSSAECEEPKIEVMASVQEAEIVERVSRYESKSDEGKYD
jgi:hypothetical protein